MWNSQIINLKKNNLILLIIICLFFCSGAVMADSLWKLKKDKKDIQVYTKQVEGSPYKAVKTTTLIKNTKLASMVALILDAKACKDWAPKCAESYIIKQISNTESYVYTHNSMPFPVTDRDVVSLVKWHQNPKTYEVTMNSTATADIKEKVKRRLRLKEATVSWTFKPLATGGIEVTNQAHINPGSNLPGWITNMLLVSTPFNTMKAFAKEVAKPKYRDASVDFIKEQPENEVEPTEKNK